MYTLFYKVQSEAEAFNTGEPVVDSHTCGSREEAEAYIISLLEHWPYAGYWLYKGAARLDKTPEESKLFDEEEFNRSYYGTDS